MRRNSSHESWELSHEPHPYEPVHYGSGFQSGGESSTNPLGAQVSKNPFSRYKLVGRSEDDLDRQGSEQAFRQPLELPPRTETFRPGRTGKFGTDLVLEIILCASAVLATVPFLWLAVTIALYDGKAVHTTNTNDADFIKQSTSTVSTLFTILFAAVVGTTLKRYATWHLAKGAKLGFLEQIMQSRTFFAAITTQMSMGFINFTTILLLCTWAFSPLGSQACLRLISTHIELTEFTANVSHVDTITNQVFDSVSGVSSLLTSLKPTYVSTILGPPTTKRSPVDLWGNVKIPSLVSNASKDDQGWIDYSGSDLTEAAYSALIGVPMTNLSSDNSSFVIETTYIHLDCESPKNELPVDIGVLNATASTNGSFVGPNTTFSLDDGIYPSWQLAMDQFVSDAYFYGYPQQLENYTVDEVKQATLLFQTRNATSRCQIDQIYVESNISCIENRRTFRSDCAVSAQRESPRKHAPAAVTTFSFASTFSSEASAWILATGELSSSGYSSLAEYYLQNTSAQFILAGNNRNFANYSNVTADEFSTRLGQLLNTWILAGQISADTMDFGLNHENITATYSDGKLVWEVSWAWLTVYCVAIAVMFAAALLTIWCAFHTSIPDVLSYCSSLTRDSRYFDYIPAGGSTLDGLRRSKAMRDVEIRLGEVDRPSEPLESPHLHRQQQQGGFSNDIPESGAGLGYLAIGPADQVRVARRGMAYA